MQENINIPDSTITTNLSFRQLVLMNMQQLTNFPYIEKDFDALTDYELLCLVVKFLNDVIANQNEQNDSITRMYESFLALQTYVNNTKDTLEDAFNNLDDYVRNYFDNLDVQEEINNKLDQMLEDGVLEQIIEQFIQSTALWCFDTVADMQQGSNLIVGSYVQTLGYYSINDEGASKYKIVSSADENEYQIQVGNLYANLLRSDTINIHQFGVKGDGTTDDTDNINKAYTFASNKSVANINFGKNKTYMVRGYEVGQAEGATTGLSETTGIILPSNTTTDMCGSTLKIITNSRQNYNAFTIKESENIILKNGKIIGDVGYHTGSSGQWGYGVSIRQGKNIKLENLYCTLCWGDGININFSNDHDNLNDNISIINCICYDNRRQGMSIENGKNIYVKDSQFNNTGVTAHHNPASGVDIEPVIDLDIVRNVSFENCLFNNNYNDGLCIGNDTEYVSVKNCKFIGNLGTSSQSTCSIIDGNKIIFDNCYFGDENNNFKTLPIQPSGDILFINNKFYDGKYFCSSNFLNKGTIKFINNKFYRKTITTDYNGMIETYTSDTTTQNDNNTLLIENNEFYNISDNRQLNINYIRSSYDSKFKTLICKNNIFKDSKNAIRTVISSIISNNIFITSYQHPIFLVQSTSHSDEITHSITDNIFEECSYAATTDTVGVILTGTNKNINITDNVYFKKTLNSNNYIDNPTNVPTRMTVSDTTTGGSQLERNVILDN